jgi:glycosyltransferase involved in cell wall biosynthesis
MKLSVLVPLYNEEEFVGALLEKVIAAPLPPDLDREIIVADDGSTDSSIEEVERVAEQYPGMIRLLKAGRNQGKGAALRRAIAAADGELCIIQDADLEYDPREYQRILAPLLDGRADVVYGSRFMVSAERRVLYFWHSLANQLLTGMCNIFADLNLTDMETCYKAFRTSLLKSIPLRSQRFGFEPEITIKLAKRQARIYEVPISYNGRTYQEGKKIGLKDALEAFYVILKYSLSRDIYVNKDKDILDAFSGALKFNRWMADTIQPYLGKRVLEIGAGIGNLTRILVSRRTKYVATDLDREHLERLRARLAGRPKLEVAVLDASRTEDYRPFRGQMDTVVCLNVLEHIEDDLGTLRNIHSALYEGGRAIILVPEGQSIYCSLDEELGHWRRYSEEQLRRRMEEAGFVVETVLRFNRISRPGWWLNGKILKRRTISRLQLENFDRMVPLFRRIDAHLPWSPASIIAVGRKHTASGAEEKSGPLPASDSRPFDFLQGEIPAES